MSPLAEQICNMTGAQSAVLGEPIQQLWSGYGVIRRAVLHGVTPTEVVIKHIDLSHARSNRRGWGGEQSHRRKVRSYQVEKKFYESFARRCDTSCRVPRFVAAREKANESGWLILLEDVDSVGFSIRKDSLERPDVEACLAWLANFHATFLGDPADGLWPIGTYWHLETRPDELLAMPDGNLKRLAEEIDARLNAAKFQTLVHGDAKVANFCFSASGEREVVAVDFQYVGRGSGMKDVAYFISSCLNDRQAAAQQDSLLDYYFEQLSVGLERRGRAAVFAELEVEWRLLYRFAWADFCRFLVGWSPNHWKLNSYVDRVTQSVLDELSSG